MRVAPLERRRIHCCAELVDLIPAHTGASHARIDLDMEGTLARGPFEDAARVAERRSQLMAVGLVEQSRARRHEGKDRPRDAGHPQAGPFFDRPDTVAPG